MEHPYLFFVKLFEMIGLDHFAHEYPHVVYSWVVMALLMISGAVASKNITMIPAKMQNFFEVIISGIEEFMVDNTGEEGRWLLPLAATVFMYVFVGNLIGLVPGFFWIRKRYFTYRSEGGFISQEKKYPGKGGDAG